MHPLAGSSILQFLRHRVTAWYAGSRLLRPAAVLRGAVADSYFLAPRVSEGGGTAFCYDLRTPAGSLCARTLAAAAARWTRALRGPVLARRLPYLPIVVLLATVGSAAVLLGPGRAAFVGLGLVLAWASWRHTATGLLLLTALVLVKWQLKQWWPDATLWLTLAPPLLLLLTFAGWFARAGIPEDRPPALLPVDKGLLLILGSIVLSNVNSFLVYHRPANLLYESLVWVQAAGVYLTARAGLNHLRQVRGTVAGLLVLGLLLAVVGLHQAWTGFKTPGTWVESYDEAVGSRIISTVGNPNGLGGYFNTVLLPAAAWVLFGAGRARWTLALGMVPLALALLYTYSRGAWLGCAAALLFLALYYNRRSWAAFLVVVLAALLVVPATVVERLLNIFHPAHLASSETAGRLWSLSNVLYILPRHRWLGVGLGMYGGTTAYNMFSPVYDEGQWAGYVAVPFVDNLFLHVLIQQGVLGLVAFLVFAGTVLLTCHRIFRAAGTPLVRALAAGTGAAWVAYLVQGLAATSTEFPQMTVPVWLLLGLTAAAHRLSCVPSAGEGRQLDH
ncbi:MAG: O-antigen ligase family protein [Desulfotomaculales bacterium]